MRSTKMRFNHRVDGLPRGKERREAVWTTEDARSAILTRSWIQRREGQRLNRRVNRWSVFEEVRKPPKSRPV